MFSISYYIRILNQLISNKSKGPPRLIVPDQHLHSYYCRLQCYWGNLVFEAWVSFSIWVSNWLSFSFKLETFSIKVNLITGVRATCWNTQWHLRWRTILFSQIWPPTLISRKVDQKLEFPRNRLILDETIGEGEFGRVGVIVFNYFQRSQTIYFTWFKLD